METKDNNGHTPLQPVQEGNSTAVIVVEMLSTYSGLWQPVGVFPDLDTANDAALDLLAQMVPVRFLAVEYNPRKRE